MFNKIPRFMWVYMSENATEVARAAPVDTKNPA